MNLIISLGLFFLAVVIHEFAHAFVAFRRGDQTAQRMGRLTLNPLAHIDPFGTIVLPLLLIVMRSPVLFGYAKPVPVNFRNLKNPKQDMIWVGLAGPAANLILATLIAVTLRWELFPWGGFNQILFKMLLLNVVLAVFNLLPLPPLDGSRVLMGLLPVPMAMRYASLEPYGFMILFALLYIGIIDYFVLPVSAQIVRLLML
ncbi:MAG: site-2 protease family protein [Candidatus Omnitrophota bacterium]